MTAKISALNKNCWISQTEIAKSLGISKGAVSQALHGTGNLSQETRSKIIEYAKSLGYVPDPLLASLSSHRRGHSQEKNVFKGLVAILLSKDFRQNTFISPLFEEINKEAEKQGYLLEKHHPMDDFEKNPKRLAEIFRSRGAHGLIVADYLSECFFTCFPWEYFACLTVIRRNENLPLDLIDQDVTRSCIHAFDACRERGYRRLGVALHREADQSVGNRFFHILKGYSNNMPELFAPNPFFYFNEKNKGEFQDWLAANSPDAILMHEQIPQLLDFDSDSSIFRGVGVAILNLRDLSTGYSGINLPLKVISEIAIRTLDQRIRYHVEGISPHRQTILLEGNWHEGKSLPSKN